MSERADPHFHIYIYGEREIEREIKNEKIIQRGCRKNHI
jgi:hypothetical protein